MPREEIVQSLGPFKLGESTKSEVQLTVELIRYGREKDWAGRLMKLSWWEVQLTVELIRKRKGLG